MLDAVAYLSYNIKLLTINLYEDNLFPLIDSKYSIHYYASPFPFNFKELSFLSIFRMFQLSILNSIIQYKDFANEIRGLVSFSSEHDFLIQDPIVAKISH